MKEELAKWKKEKELKKAADLTVKQEHDARIASLTKRKISSKRDQTKTQIEEYKFRKEMDKEKEVMLQNMEKKMKPKVDQTALERIKKRELEMIKKKDMAFESRQNQILEK